MSMADRAQRSKRANSSTLVFERNKFRATTLMEANSNTATTAAAAAGVVPTPYAMRHYSASSVTQSTWSNSLVSPLSPMMAQCWRDNIPMSTQWPVLMITADQLCSIMDWHYKHALPECEEVFPWLHGVHSENHTQREFLSSLKDFTSVHRNQFDSLTHQRIPSATRGFMPVRSCALAGDYYKKSGVLKGSVDPQDILCTLDISKAVLMNLLTNLLDELNLNDDMTLSTLFDDCSELGLLPLFRNLDPQRGISLRNFHIQVAKMAQISDFAVYCFNNHLEDDSCCCESVSRVLYFAQLKHSIDHPELVDPMYQTVLVEDIDLEFFTETPQEKYLALNKVPTDAFVHTKGSCYTTYDVDLYQSWECDYLLREKIEISKMSSATSIFQNVWLGNTMDYEAHKQKGFHSEAVRTSDSSVPLYIDPANSTVTVKQSDLSVLGESLLINAPSADWSLHVNCTDGAGFPPLSTVEYLIEEKEQVNNNLNLRFPPSGSLGIGDCNDSDIRTIINVCKLLYTRSEQGKSSLIYCTDGYTESSLLAVCFMIYSTGKPLHEACVDLHNVQGRPFFLFPTDAQLISRLQPILQHFSPKNVNIEYDPNIAEDVNTDFVYKQLFLQRDMSWFLQLAGSLPSRILQHLYLGSLTHANSFELLEEFGIEYVVSVGESLQWLDQEEDVKRDVINPNITILSGFRNSVVKKLMCVSNVQDDGIDMLTHNLSDILDFIDDVYQSSGKVLVHCRVGVSRSATVCIAEVMRRLEINLIKAYIFVRVRRLNIIIQPNLRFMYELVKWEEAVRISQRMQKNKSLALHSSVLDTPQNSKHESTEMSKRLSTSMSSMSSSFTDLSTCSPVRHIRAELSHEVAITDEEDLGGSIADMKEHVDLDDLGVDVFDEGDEWLRDVDWHILCREIDALNKAYIRF